MANDVKIDDPQTDVVFKYKTIRSIIGLIALAIPWICIIAVWMAQDGKWLLPTSISVSYHLGAGDVFVGMLAIVSAFLFAYNGHRYPHFTLFGKPRKVERIMAVMAGICALGVALSPTSIDKTWMDELANRGYILADFPSMSLDYIDANGFGECTEKKKNIYKCTLSKYPITPDIHIICAVILFLVLIGFCYNFIKRTGKKLEKLAVSKGDKVKIEETKSKIRWRRRFYWFSAVLMLLSGLLAAVAYFDVFGESVALYSVMIVEFGCLTGFGISWFVSGSGMLRGNDADEIKVTAELDTE